MGGWIYGCSAQFLREISAVFSGKGSDNCSAEYSVELLESLRNFRTLNLPRQSRGRGCQKPICCAKRCSSKAIVKVIHRLLLSGVVPKALKKFLGGLRHHLSSAKPGSPRPETAVASRDVCPRRKLPQKLPERHLSRQRGLAAFSRRVRRARRRPRKLLL